MSSKALASKPHAVCVSAPYLGHIKPTIKLAKLLYHKGVHITFVNTEFIHKRLLKSRGLSLLDGLPGFRFEVLPDGLSLSDSDTSPDLISTIDSVRTKLLSPFLNLLHKLNDTASSDVPPVTCIVSDSFMSLFTVTAAQQLGIPVALFLPVSACSFMGILHLKLLQVKGLTPLQDESCLTNDQYMNTIIDCIPGMKGIRFRDLPSFVRTTDPQDIVADFVVKSNEKDLEALAIIVNTFDALEQQVLSCLSTIFPRVYAVGPLHLLVDQTNHHPMNTIGDDLWTEEHECLQWLDSKAPSSVVYVSFGSLVIMTKEQLIEFGMGIANSNHNFLWVIRSDLVVGESLILPPAISEETKGRGYITTWCPQEEVLKHPSIGGFLTHSGWNSTIESLSAGVPMLCWPVLADQMTNCRYVCKEWGIGLEIDGDVKRSDVENLLRELMEGDKGKDMRIKAMGWRKMAKGATDPNGSSSINLAKLVSEVIIGSDCQ